MYLQVSLPAWTSYDSTTGGWCDWVGHALIKNVEVEIGGQRIKNIGAQEYQAFNTICAY